MTPLSIGRSFWIKTNAMQQLINLAHLNEQSFGDADLRREILEMFQTLTPPLIEAFYATTGSARSDIAHRIKGSCLAIGATELGNAATILELTPNAEVDLRAIADATAQEIKKLLA
jgi:HPt (histidine-containing phosphotransfer) domain-containing protein